MQEFQTALREQIQARDRALAALERARDRLRALAEARAADTNTLMARLLQEPPA